MRWDYPTDDPERLLCDCEGKVFVQCDTLTGRHSRFCHTTTVELIRWCKLKHYKRIAAASVLEALYGSAFSRANECEKWGHKNAAAPVRASYKRTGCWLDLFNPG